MNAVNTNLMAVASKIIRSWSDLKVNGAVLINGDVDTKKNFALFSPYQYRCYTSLHENSGHNCLYVGTTVLRTEQRVLTPQCCSESLLSQEKKLASLNLLKPTSYLMHQQFNIQQLYALPTLYLCVLYLSENKQRLVPLTA